MRYEYYLIHKTEDATYKHKQFIKLLLKDTNISIEKLPKQYRNIYIELKSELEADKLKEMSKKNSKK